jgi:hypothetical protein
MTSEELSWITLFLGCFTLLFFVSLLCARKDGELLEKRNAALIKEVENAEKAAAVAREDANSWRTTANLQSEQARLQNSALLSHIDSLRQQSDQRQLELDVTRQMCRDLPAAQTRVLELEKELAVERHQLSQLLHINVAPQSPTVTEPSEPEGAENDGAPTPETLTPTPLTAETFEPAAPLAAELQQVRTALIESQIKSARLEKDLALARLKARKIAGRSKKARA